MTTQVTNQNNQSDEIDLIELVKVLWNKKWWIVLSTFVCTSLAGIYAFTAKEQWTSTAEIIEPRATDLGNYLNLRQEYARILGTDFDLGALSTDLYSKFERLAYSLDERKAFLEKTDLYRKLSQDIDAEEQRRVLNTLAKESIGIIKSSSKKADTIGRQYVVSSESPKLSQDTLKAFVQYINERAFQLELNEFLLFANEKILDLKLESKKIIQNLNIQQNVQLENLRKALETATKAGIKDYSKVLDGRTHVVMNNISISDARIPLSDSKLSDSTYLFMLGEKYLKAQIDSSIQKGIIYPPKYYQIQEHLKELVPLLNSIKDAKANAFSYLSSPDYPVAKDKPKKSLILIIGFAVGLILSSFTVLVIGFIRKK